MTIKTFTITLLLTASFLLFTACDSKTNTNTTNDQNLTSQGETPTGTDDEGTNSGGEGGGTITSGGTTGSSGSTDGNTEVDTSTGGGDDSNATAEGDDDNNTTTSPTITLASLKLTVDKTTLNKDENTTVKVMATYSDSSTKDVTDTVEWVVIPSDAVKMTNAALTVLQDKATTVKAKLNTVVSDAVSLNITWTVNGHMLPPEPDKATNDSTLLGIDSNDNGVRDDVERWIYEEYKDKHPIHIDIAMQAGRAYKLVLETPERAKEIMKFVEAPLYCELYYRYCVDNVNINEKRLIGENEEIDSKYFRRKVYFNTQQRWDVYLQYDMQFSGDSYTLPRCNQQKKMCDFNTSKYEE